MGVLSIAAVLAVVALAAVVTVVRSVKCPIVALRPLKTFVLMLLFIAPALAVVGLIGAVTLVPTHAVKESRRVERGPISREMATMNTAATTTKTAIPTEETRIVAEARPGVFISAAPPERIPSGGAKKAGPQPTADAANAEARAGLKASQAEVRSRVAAAASEAAAKIREAAASHVQFPAPPMQVLKVREMATSPPEWAGKDPQPGSDGVLVHLSSQRWATLGEAEQQVTKLAAAYINEFYREENPLPGDWKVPVAVIEQHAVQSIAGEEFEQDFGNGTRAKMYRAHLQMNLNSGLRQALQGAWNGQIVERRLVVLGSLTGFVTLVLATFAGYFRLDDLTQGQYRRRLKLAAAALIAAGSLVVAVVP